MCHLDQLEQEGTGLGLHKQCIFCIFMFFCWSGMFFARTRETRARALYTPYGFDTKLQPRYSERLCGAEKGRRRATEQRALGCRKALARVKGNKERHTKLICVFP